VLLLLLLLLLLLPPLLRHAADMATFPLLPLQGC
jgi:hypothetical protein